MSEPLDLEQIKKRKFSQYAAVDDRLALLAEVDRLRDEVTDRANVEADLRAQLAEVQAALHVRFGNRSDYRELAGGPS